MRSSEKTLASHPAMSDLSLAVVLITSRKTVLTTVGATGQFLQPAEAVADRVAVAEHRIGRSGRATGCGEPCPGGGQEGFAILVGQVEQFAEDPAGQVVGGLRIAGDQGGDRTVAVVADVLGSGRHGLELEPVIRDARRTERLSPRRQTIGSGSFSCTLPTSDPCGSAAIRALAPVYRLLLVSSGPGSSGRPSSQRPECFAPPASALMWCTRLCTGIGPLLGVSAMNRKVALRVGALDVAELSARGPAEALTEIENCRIRSSVSDGNAGTCG